MTSLHPPQPHPTRGPLLLALAGAALFEIFTVAETQDRALMTASPWREDPYHTVVLFSGAMVAVLGLRVVLQLLTRRASEPADPACSRTAPDPACFRTAPDPARRASPHAERAASGDAEASVRPAVAMTVMVGLALAFEWAAVGLWSPSHLRPPATAELAGLIAGSLLTLAGAAVLLRFRQPGPHPARGECDGLSDFAFLCRDVPVLGPCTGGQGMAWLRVHANSVFLGLSLLVAAALTTAQAIGEGWTDPLLIGWMLVAVTGTALAVCVIGNAVCGFVARPVRTRASRITETSMVAGSLAMLVAIAFHDTLWDLVASGPLTSVPTLAGLSLGLGLAAATIVAVVSLIRPWRPIAGRRDRG